MTVKVESSEIGLTREIAIIVSQMNWADLPEAGRIMARHAVLDFFGVLIAGYDEPLAKILRDSLAAGGTAPILGSALMANTRDAALINGATGHALDYDDVSIIGHPTTAILPAVLAVGQARKLSCQNVLLSYIVGYEAASIVATHIQPSHYEQGFHSTGTLGSIGAAAAVAHLLQLDTKAIAVAIGLAATQAAGLKAQFGTMAKPFHAGKAASNGVLAAELAAAGFEGRENVLEVEQGFFSTQSNVVSSPVGDYVFGQHIQNNLFKYHASCHCTHAMIESLRRLMTAHDFGPADIRKLDVHVPPGYLNVANIEEPVTGLECKFSLKHCAALTVAGHNTASIDTFNKSSATDPNLVDLRRRVEVIGDGKNEAYMTVRTNLQLRDGTELDNEYDAGIPESDFALQEKKLSEKFDALVNPRRENAKWIREKILNFDQLQSMNDLAELIA